MADFSYYNVRLRSICSILLKICGDAAPSYMPRSKYWVSLLERTPS